MADHVAGPPAADAGVLAGGSRRVCALRGPADRRQVQEVEPAGRLDLEELGVIGQLGLGAGGVDKRKAPVVAAAVPGPKLPDHRDERRHAGARADHQDARGVPRPRGEGEAAGDAVLIPDLAAGLLARPEQHLAQTTRQPVDAVLDPHEELEPAMLGGVGGGGGDGIGLGDGTDGLPPPGVVLGLAGRLAVGADPGLAGQLAVVPPQGDVLPRLVVGKAGAGRGGQPEPHQGRGDDRLVHDRPGSQLRHPRPFTRWPRATAAARRCSASASPTRCRAAATPTTRRRAASVRRC